jgi:hypothetical protein
MRVAEMVQYYSSLYSNCVSLAAVVVALVIAFPVAIASATHVGARVTATPSNSPPELVPLTELLGVAGASLEFAATATDPDNDALTCTWNFGDGSPLTVGNPVTHTYALAGRYNYSVHVDDSNGHEVSSYAYAWAAFQLYLGWTGWDLITVPLAGWGYRASTLPLDLGDVIVHYDHSTGTQTSYTFGISPPFKDFPILPHEGYWLHTTRAKTLNVYGYVPTEMQKAAISIPPTGGWIVFGFLGLTTHKASQIPGMYSGGVTVVAYYDHANMRILTWVVGGPPFRDFSIPPGMGIFIWVNSSGVLSYNP